MRTTIHINRKISLVSNKAHRSCLPKFKTTSRVGDGVLDGNLLIYLPTTHLIRRYFTQPAPIISSTQKNDEIMNHIFLSRLKFHYDGRHIIIPSHIKFIPELCIIRKISCFFQSKVDLHQYFPLSCHLRTITIRKHVSYSGTSTQVK